jgi:chromosomal replication initiator protein
MLGDLKPMQSTELWGAVCSALKGEMSAIAYKTWIATLSVVREQKDGVHTVMVLETPTSFNRQFLDSRYSALVSNALTQASGRAYLVKFVTPEERQYAAPDRSQESAAQNSAPLLNPKYTFDTFVVGNSNLFAHAASLAVAEAPAMSYNPLFIYGGAGLGKTHLLYAIGHYIHEQYPNFKVMYVTMENFTNEFIRAIQTNANEAFRNRYRNVDTLLIDDVQVIAGKERTQEELFHTFNALFEAQKQIVLSSDKPPRQIDIEERLRSRFEWGLIADIQPPDLETRIAILQKKAETEGIPVEADVLEFIAMRSENNIRELQGALNRAAAFARVSQKPLDLALAREALKELISASSSRMVSPESIVAKVSERFGVSVEELKSKNKQRRIADARQVCMYLVREMTDLSLPRIGEIFNRDHTTVLHGWRTISSAMAEDAEMRTLLADMQRELFGK